MQGRNPMRGQSPMRGRSPKVVNAGPKPDARPKPDMGPKPHVELKPNAGSKPNTVNAGAKPDAGPKPKSRPKPDAEPKPNTVNAGLKPDAGPKPKSNQYRLDRKVQEMQKQRSTLGNSTWRCKAVTLICLRSLWREGGNSVLKSKELDERRLLSQLWLFSIQAVFLLEIFCNGKKKQ
ncbi:hypothetical protein CDL15_Pgr016489 [Punica granatum]|uniref:Uncharacterized protein n=1 Tax=Punica granatum TaxID=22663 RepID=A0A218WXS1_PUNGR|nr:hypothetical protein CDL15_Pgr016489 [Punica granatum]